MRGDGSEVLEFVEEAFDEVALAVERDRRSVAPFGSSGWGCAARSRVHGSAREPPGRRSPGRQRCRARRRQAGEQRRRVLVGTDDRAVDEMKRIRRPRAQHLENPPPHALLSDVPGIVVHAHGKRASRSRGKHGLRNARHLRELPALADIEGEARARRMRQLLRRANRAARIARAGFFRFRRGLRRRSSADRTNRRRGAGLPQETAVVLARRGDETPEAMDRSQHGRAGCSRQRWRGPAAAGGRSARRRCAPHRRPRG